MFKKWEKIVSVNPRTPSSYSRFIINTKKYLLHKNATTNASKLAIPLLVAPSQLGQPMKELFNKQEQERYKLRQQHLIEGVGRRPSFQKSMILLIGNAKIVNKLFYKPSNTWSSIASRLRFFVWSCGTFNQPH